jgi:hypothetical protein
MVFCGLGALVVCVFALLHWSNPAQVQDYETEPLILGAEDDSLTAGSSNFLARVEPPRSDYILGLCRQPESRGRVVDFFTELCNSARIAEAVLTSAEEFDIPPSLAFALCWQESEFYPQAYNGTNLNGSVDRGLFQLNNLSFPYLKVAEFYDPKVNVYHAMKHLRVCIDISGGSEITALAVYNAGANRVRNTGAPMRTLSYINNIQENRIRIENRFLEWESIYQEQLEDTETVEEGNRNRFNFIPLIPLGIR